MATIDLSNYATTLHQASTSGFTDGNIFFDTTAGEVHFGDATTAATYTPQGSTAATTINQTATDTLVRTTGSFTADGWRAGMKFTLGGTTANNGTYTIESISTTTNPNDTITTVETSIATESGSGDETLTAASTTNALLNLDGLKFEGLYAFENQERRLDESLRAYDRFTAGTFKFGGAYDFVNGRTPNADADRKLFRGSGWRELTGSTVNRIYFGPKGLGAILTDSVPYYQTSQYADVTDTDMFDFTKLGNIDEAFQVYGDAANGNFDNTLSSHYFSIRTYGQNFGRISTGVTLGIAELGGYSSGAALNESTHLTTNTGQDGNVHPYASVAPNATINLTSQTVDFHNGNATLILNNATPADNDWIALGFGVGSVIDVVSGSTTAGNDTTYTISTITTTTDTNDTATVSVAPGTTEVGTGTQVVQNNQIAPWTGMTLEKHATTQSKTGFTQADGNFFWTLNNTSPGDLNECIAYLDALSTIDATINTGTPSLNGKAYDVWYEYTPAGKIRPVVGTSDGWHSGQTGTQGLFIDALAGTDKLRVEFLDDSGNTKTYPVYTPVTVEIGQGAIDDTLAWFHSYLAANYNTGSAVEYDDAQSVVVKGVADNTSPFITGANTYVDFEHDFSTDGSTNIVFLCEGDGGVTQQKTAITLADTTVAASCIPAVENNV